MESLWTQRARSLARISHSKTFFIRQKQILYFVFESEWLSGKVTLYQLSKYSIISCALYNAERCALCFNQIYIVCNAVYSST